MLNTDKIYLGGDSVGPGTVKICWTGGAGFIIEYAGTTIGIDLYLSDICRGNNGSFKRLVPSPVNAEALKLDFLVATHDHGDHFDKGSINVIVNPNTGTKLIGPGSVLRAALDMDIDSSLVYRLDRGEAAEFGCFKIYAVYCDHGEQSHDAIGVIIEIGGKRIYFTSDTCYRADLYKLINLEPKIDILLVPINGKYGNPDSKDAAYITAWVKPKIVIPCHFWLFKEHGGDPGSFVECCRKIAPESEVNVLAVGETIVV